MTADEYRVEIMAARHGQDFIAIFERIAQDCDVLPADVKPLYQLRWQREEAMREAYKKAIMETPYRNRAENILLMADADPAFGLCTRIQLWDIYESKLRLAAKRRKEDESNG